MRVYISGKMTGCPDLNRPAFDAAEKRLTAQGHFVINPAELSAQFGTPDEIAESFSWAYGTHEGKPIVDFHVGDIVRGGRLACAVMDADLAAVRSCDAIYLLKGWEKSRGAKKELAEAIKCGLEVMLAGGEE